MSESILQNLKSIECKYDTAQSIGISGANLQPTGVLCVEWSVGGSVAKASAPRVSMIRLTHRSCTKKTYTSTSNLVTIRDS